MPVTNTSAQTDKSTCSLGTGLLVSQRDRIHHLWFPFPRWTSSFQTSGRKLWLVMTAVPWSFTLLICLWTKCAWAASVQWPSDSVIRQWALEKRGLGLFGPEKAQQVSKLKVSPRCQAAALDVCADCSDCGRVKRKGVCKGPGAPLQGATWAYDWRLGEDQAFVAACAANGVEYVPMIVSASLSACAALATLAVVVSAWLSKYRP